MYNVRRYVIRLTDEDLIAITMEFDDANRMVNAVVNYHALFRDYWHEVGRYDTAHGVPHLHRFWLGPESVRPLPNVNVHQMVDQGKRNLLLNWHSYRARMEARTP